MNAYLATLCHKCSFTDYSCNRDKINVVLCANFEYSICLVNMNSCLLSECKTAQFTVRIYAKMLETFAQPILL